MIKIPGYQTLVSNAVYLGQEDCLPKSERSKGDIRPVIILTKHQEPTANKIIPYLCERALMNDLTGEIKSSLDEDLASLSGPLRKMLGREELYYRKIMRDVCSIIGLNRGNWRLNLLQGRLPISLLHSQQEGLEWYQDKLYDEQLSSERKDFGYRYLLSLEMGKEMEPLEIEEFKRNFLESPIESSCHLLSSAETANLRASEIFEVVNNLYKGLGYIKDETSFGKIKNLVSKLIPFTKADTSNSLEEVFDDSNNAVELGAKKVLKYLIATINSPMPSKPTYLH